MQQQQLHKYIVSFKTSRKARTIKRWERYATDRAAAETSARAALEREYSGAALLVSVEHVAIVVARRLLVELAAADTRDDSARATFVRKFEEMLREQRLTLDGYHAILSDLDEPQRVNLIIMQNFLNYWRR